MLVAIYLYKDTHIRIYSYIHLTAHCISLVEEELHWIVVVCIERGEVHLVERMQALKLMKKFLLISGDIFPIAFARSLVAISNHKDDNLRRICLETLRELCVINPKVCKVIFLSYMILFYFFFVIYTTVLVPVVMIMMFA